MDAIAKLDAILAQLTELRAELLTEHVPNFSALSDEATDVDDFNELNLIEVTAAAERFAYPANTIRHWCRNGGDGVRRGGRWLVSIPRVQRRLNGGC